MGVTPNVIKALTCIDIQPYKDSVPESNLREEAAE